MVPRPRMLVLLPLPPTRLHRTSLLLHLPRLSKGRVMTRPRKTSHRSTAPSRACTTPRFPVCTRRIRELVQRVQQMEQLLATMSSPAQPPAAAPATPTQRHVTDKDVEEYGESIDVMRKVSREEVGSLMSRIGQLESLLQQVQTKVVPQVQAVAQRQQVSAEQTFWSDLTKTVPNWREVNDNGSFQEWLLKTDPLTGISRQTYLDDAQRSLDAGRVSAFFRTWLESTGQATAQSTGSAPPPPQANPELQKQVAPGRSRSAGTPQTNQGKVYSRDDIAKFFDDVRSGKYKGREQERSRIERDIFAAQRENRIQATA
jgi:hypothetical protein